MIKSKLLSLLGLIVAAHPLIAQEATTNSGPPPMPLRPNIILIVADDLGYGDLGCYGQRNIKTPNLDHMASEGVRFTDFYAGSPSSATARASLLTGRDAGHLKISDDAIATLPDGAPTVAEILKQAGYATGCLGEWDFGQSANTPPKRGFDEWAGLLTADAQTDYPEFISRYDPPRAGVGGYDGVMQISQNEHGLKGMSINDLFTTAAMNFAQNNRPDQFNKYRPFFLMLNYTLPRVRDRDSAAPYELEGWPKAEKFKAAAVTRLDANIGKIIARLYELGQASNTIVFVTSDGGARKAGGGDPKYHKSSGNLRGNGGELLEGGLRVPLIVWGLGNLKSGEENYQPAAAWDLFPTFVEIAIGKLPDKLDGLSLLPPLQGKSQPRRHEFLFWESYPDRAQAVRYEDWKAIRTKPGKALELYSLKADAAEKSNVAKDDPEIVAKIDAYLKTVRNELPQK